MKNNKFVVIPPAGAGSKGDEGMMIGVINLLASTALTILNPQQGSWLAEISGLPEASSEELFTNEALRRLVEDGYTTVVVGADVIDGSAGLSSSLLRIEAISEVVNGLGKVLVFFSFRSDPDAEIVERLNAVAGTDGVHFYLRDMHSLDRFSSRFPTARCEFFPDLAFYCIPSLSAYQRESSYPRNINQLQSQPTVIALNFSEQSFRATQVPYTTENRKAYVRGICRTVADAFPNTRFLIVANDIRSWDGFWSDHDYATLAHSFIESILPSADVKILDPTIGYREVIAELNRADLLVSGRMHLAIAAVLGGCIPVIVTGQSYASDLDEKQRGMFDKARGMLDWTIGRPDFVVTSGDGLANILNVVKGEYVEIRAQFLHRRDLLPDELSKYSRAFRDEHAISCTDDQCETVSFSVTPSQVAALKLEKFQLERELLGARTEAVERGAWGKSLDEEVLAVRTRFQMLESQHKVVCERNDHLANELSGVRQSMGVLGEDLRNAVKRNDSLNDELAALMKDAGKVRDENRFLREENERLVAAAEASSGNCRCVESALSQIKATVGAEHLSCEEVVVRLQGMKAEIGELKRLLADKGSIGKNDSFVKILADYKAAKSGGSFIEGRVGGCSSALATTHSSCRTAFVSGYAAFDKLEATIGSLGLSNWRFAIRGDCSL